MKKNTYLRGGIFHIQQAAQVHILIKPGAGFNQYRKEASLFAMTGTGEKGNG